MMMATDKKFMGQFVIGFRLKVAGGICTGVMAQVVIAMFATYFFETALRIVSPQLIPVLQGWRWVSCELSNRLYPDRCLFVPKMLMTVIRSNPSSTLYLNI